MRRRELIALLGGAAAAWPLAAHAQQGERMRRIGVLLPFDENAPETRGNIVAFQQTLEGLGRKDGGNVLIEYRWIRDLSRIDSTAAELVAMGPDVILTATGVVVSALKRETTTIPIVFVLTPDPVGIGLVASLARPGGDVTGFTHFEYPTAGKWLEVLKEIAPKVERVLVLQHSSPSAPGIKAVGAIEAVGQSVGVNLTTVWASNAAEIRQAIEEFAKNPSESGLLPTASPLMSTHRELIVALAAQYRLPSSYPYRHFVDAGGLVSYSIDSKEQFRQAARYVDRILKGEKPSDLPAQAPTKFELVINLKTAKALGLEVPDELLARADEVIE
jgi:putative ABC transport system substrate-binding protein